MLKVKVDFGKREGTKDYMCESLDDAKKVVDAAKDFNLDYEVYDSCDDSTNEFQVENWRLLAL